MLSSAAMFFKVKESDLSPFITPDPFNPDNTLEGYLCRTADYRYGALYLTAINKECIEPQIIWGTPKMHYPFDKQGRWQFPPVKRASVYTKLDGTNVLGFSYKFKGKYFVTYKTRMTPVLRDGSFGNFLSMWKEMLDKYPSIPQHILNTGLNLSFELYGSRNRILIIYGNTLDCALLFGVTRTIEPKIVDPFEIHTPGVPHVDGFAITSMESLVCEYEKLVLGAESKNITTEFGIEGTEGYVMYCHCTDGKVVQYKAKPASVTKIHFASGGPDNNSILTTCYNAFEETDNPTIEMVKRLLLEEFPEKVIEGKHEKIARILAITKEDVMFRKNVMRVYAESKLSLFNQKVETMRYMSQHFSKVKMGYIYFILTSTLRG